MDVHSWFRPGQPRVRHLELDLDILFDRKILNGSVRLNYEPGESPELVLDTRDLQIHGVKNAAGFELGAPDPILGSPLRIRTLPGETYVRVHYSTSPAATGLQWLEPSQTAGKQHPFLYSQSQAIHARSWVPLQDSPAIRITFDAHVSAPDGLIAVMAAGHGRDGSFAMKHPIPPYLLALAAGNLGFRELGPRTGVYAEPELLEAAAYEFAETEAMMAAVEELYGPYRWDRYDLLVLPPSFPFGGMENPCLTFATPTVIAGDRSLVSLVAHELAHSWSGNLVTNATWSDFWLNEGFTVYVERRILERLYGPERAEMEAVLGRREVDREMSHMPEQDRILHLDLEGRDPDDGCTLVPYEKGALFLRTLEQAVGRPRFDAFVRRYFDHFAFHSITTGEFLDYLERELPTSVPVQEWIFRPGIPQGAAEPRSEAFRNVESAALPDSAWSTHEWLHFLRTRERPGMEELDRAYHLTESRNSEILHQWLLMSVRLGYRPAFPRLREFLGTVGRRKYLKPLYVELMKSPETAAMAREIYKSARGGYHHISRATIDAIVGFQPQGAPQS
jgi:aminopeptidase N